MAIHDYVSMTVFPLCLTYAWILTNIIESLHLPKMIIVLCLTQTHIIINKNTSTFWQFVNTNYQRWNIMLNNI